MSTKKPKSDADIQNPEHGFWNNTLPTGESIPQEGEFPTEHSHPDAGSTD